MTTTPERALYRAEQLRPLLEPRSIAIMGASERPGSFGLRTLESLRGQGCRVYPVNPKYEHIAGERCYPSLAALPETPECAVIAVPREGVEALVRQCADAGVGGAIVYASGYAETRKAGHLELQSRLTAIARASGMPILGPNCIGIVTGGGALRITFAETPDMRTLRAGAIGIVSQSGGLGLALAQASAHGYAFSHMLTTGNACDVDVADEIAYLAEQPACAVIACVFEGMSDPRRLIDAGRLAIARGKPVVICKLATGVEGAEAAKSHTGMLAGSSAAYRAAFERAGFAVVEQFEALIETAAFFAKAGRPTSDGIAALATSGGASIMVADSAEAHGVRLPQPNDEVRRYLESQIPEFGSARNPCDVTAQILNDPGALPACADKLLACAEVSTLIIPPLCSGM